MKTRLIAAAILLPLLILLLFVAPKICTAIVGAIVSAIAVYELLYGTGIVKHVRLCVYTALTGAWVTLWCGLGIGYVWLLAGFLVFWALLFMELMLSELKLPFEKLAVCVVAGAVVPFFIGALVRLLYAENGRFLVAIPFVLAFMSDSGAYFVGLAFGKHKLAPVISPKKTVEGLFGGILGAVVGLLIYGLILQVFFKFQVNYWYILLYGLLGSLAGVFGDLSLSAIKRQTGIKDYGNLIPGHGGVLDRFDSMMMVAPLMEALLLLAPVVM